MNDQTQPAPLPPNAARQALTEGILASQRAALEALILEMRRKVYSSESIDSDSRAKAKLETEIGKNELLLAEIAEHLPAEERESLAVEYAKLSEVAEEATAARQAAILVRNEAEKALDAAWHSFKVADAVWNYALARRVDCDLKLRAHRENFPHLYAEGKAHV